MHLLCVVISAEAVDVSNDKEVISDVTWPTPEIAEQAELFKNTVPFASVRIPGDLVQRRGMASGIKLSLNICPDEHLALFNFLSKQSGFNC